MNCIRRIKLPKIEDRRGNLSVLENDILPFTFKRVYYLYDVPSGASRGGHAHKEQSEFLIALSGSFDVLINTGFETQIYTLNRPDEGLLIPNGYWRELDNFSSGGICLVLASDVFKEVDYVRNLNDFLASKKL
ncbi:FdtA/QdtA family cupin domain-containing protein [Leeuwenhoekiella polynyae]|uniref:WxcM-like protein n=1 Tax=Leeuwenhoekiella polynyae TaxID=1550906 RepID=A0A4Q0PHT7_9FLAO|nr:FdtA/QdtA family cupin domain-containing protein [Leeuwenhoekiella polynyae]RXG26138.1 WxcM-like protein [Leeuwenhoekiella polynyae]